MLQQLGTLTYRAVFISDVHLGLRESRADLLVDFLQQIWCERLYLVGDIVDGWRLRRSWYWNAAHDLFVRAVLKMAQAGVDIIYIPGNHDEALRDWLGVEIAGIRVARRAEHRSAGGLRILVTHGDEFDSAVRCAPSVAMLGDCAYDIVVRLNYWLNAARRRFGFAHWSLAQWTKQQLTAVMTVVRRYEDALATEAGKLGFDGVVCGHIHCPGIRRIGRTLYMNDGDWVESCTALVEHFDGRFELLVWPHQRPQLSRAVPPALLPIAAGIRHAQQSLPHADAAALLHRIADAEAARGE